MRGNPLKVRGLRQSLGLESPGSPEGWSGSFSERFPARPYDL